MALWETQGPCPSHEGEPFRHKQLNTKSSVVKQRRRGTRGIVHYKKRQSEQRLLVLQCLPLITEQEFYRPLHRPSSITHYTSRTKTEKVRPRSASTTASHYVYRPPPRTWRVRPSPSFPTCPTMQRLLNLPRKLPRLRQNPQQEHHSHPCPLWGLLPSSQSRYRA